MGGRGGSLLGNGNSNEETGGDLLVPKDGMAVGILGTKA